MRRHGRTQQRRTSEHLAPAPSSLKPSEATLHETCVMRKYIPCCCWLNTTPILEKHQHFYLLPSLELFTRNIEREGPRVSDGSNSLGLLVHEVPCLTFAECAPLPPRAESKNDTTICYCMWLDILKRGESVVYCRLVANLFFQ